MLYLAAVQVPKHPNDLGFHFAAVVFCHINHVRRQPIKLTALDVLWPACRVIAPFFLIGRAALAGDHEAMLGVRFVLPLGVQVKEHGAVSIEDRRDADALLLVIFVLLVLIFRMQPEGAKPAAYRLFKGIVIGFSRNAILLIGPEQIGACIGQLVIFGAVLADKGGANAVVAILADNPQYGQVNLVHLKPGLVFELRAKRAFPLGARDGIEPPVIKALQALLPQRALDAVELRHGFGMDVS